MQNAGNFGAFSAEEMKKLLASKEAKTLLKILNQDGGVRLRQAAEAVKNGDTAKAQELIAPMMQSPQAAAAVEQLNRKRDR